MKRICTMVLTLSLVALALVLGGGTPSAQAAPPANPFTGSWAGTYGMYVEGNLVQTGTAAWAVSAQGVLLGAHDPGTDHEGVLGGHVKANGNTMIISPGGAGMPALASLGESWINSDGQMEGVYTQAGQGAIVIMVVMDAV